MVVDFVVEDVANGEELVFVTGFTNEGDVRIGTLFTCILERPFDDERSQMSAKTVALKVEAIMAYSQYLDVLSRSVSGGILLSGLGRELLSKDVMLRSKPS